MQTQPKLDEYHRFLRGFVLGRVFHAGLMNKPKKFESWADVNGFNFASANIPVERAYQLWTELRAKGVE